jgi:ribosome-binding protein aMBF1 (putative translation factor)
MPQTCAADNRRDIRLASEEMARSANTRSAARRTPADLKTHGELVASELQDAEFRREWERLEFARVLAARVIEYRADHELTQTALARVLGIPQSQVARLEIAEHEPSRGTLERLAGKLGMEFTINIAPAQREPRQLTKHTREHLAACHPAGEAVVRYAAG